MSNKSIVGIRISKKVYDDFKIWCIKHDHKIGEYLEWLIKKQINSDVSELEQRKILGNNIYKDIRKLVYGIAAEQKQDIQWTE